MPAWVRAEEQDLLVLRIRNLRVQELFSRVRTSGVLDVPERAVPRERQLLKLQRSNSALPEL